MKLVGFDLETERPVPQDRTQSYALGITCAAIAYPDGVQRWQGGVQPDERFAHRMSPGRCRSLALALLEYHNQGWMLVTINGLSFDLRVLAEECQDPAMGAALQRLAWEHIDPCFDMLCKKGYPVGMQAMAEGFGLQGKSDGMDGLQAIEMWHGSRGDQEQVLEYVAQDARTTLEIAQAIRDTHTIRWVSKKGNPNSVFASLRPVRESWRRPMPDMSWWKVGDPPTRQEFAEWALDALDGQDRQPGLL